MKLKEKLLRGAVYISGIAIPLMFWHFGGKYTEVFLIAGFILVTYSIGIKVTERFFKPDKIRDNKRYKIATTLALLGLLGIFSPLLGYLFALPASLIAFVLISNDHPRKKFLLYLTWTLILFIFINAVIGAYMK